MGSNFTIKEAKELFEDITGEKVYSSELKRVVLQDDSLILPSCFFINYVRYDESTKTIVDSSNLNSVVLSGEFEILASLKEKIVVNYIEFEL